MSFEEPDTDTIYIANLPPNVTEDDLAEYFGSIGILKKDKKTRKPKIWLYRDKATGVLKGDATVSYEDPFSAGSAVEWFNDKDFKGSKLHVSLSDFHAKKREQFGGGGGGGYSRGGGGGRRGGGGYDRGGGGYDRGGDRGRGYDRGGDRGGGYDRGGDRGYDRGGDRGGGGYDRGGGGGGYDRAGGGRGGGYDRGGGHDRDRSGGHGRSGGQERGYDQSAGYDQAQQPAVDYNQYNGNQQEGYQQPDPQGQQDPGQNSWGEQGGGGAGRGAPVPKEVRDGDWQCSCGNVNFSFRGKCNRCGSSKPSGGAGGDRGRGRGGGDRAGAGAGAAAAGAGAGAGAGPAGKQKVVAAPQGNPAIFAPGDWACGSCGNMNWARRSKCNMCGASKPGTVDTNREGVGGGFKELDEQEIEEARRRRKQYEEDDSEIYDDFGRVKKKYRQTDDRKAREDAALARLHGSD